MVTDERDHAANGDSQKHKEQDYPAGKDRSFHTVFLSCSFNPKRDIVPGVA
jgi:hypothetical protein